MNAKNLCLSSLLLTFMFCASFEECWYGSFFLSLLFGALSFYVGMRKTFTLVVLDSLTVFSDSNVSQWAVGFGGAAALMWAVCMFAVSTGLMTFEVLLWRCIFRKFYPSKTA
jgi:hypothetical protein